MEKKNIHQSIASTKDGSVTEAQVNYLLSLYRELLITAIDGSKRPEDKKLKNFNNYMLFEKKHYGVKGILGLHLWSTFIPENAGYTKHSVSSMIDSARNDKFDKKFISALLKSANSYKKES